MNMDYKTNKKTITNEYFRYERLLEKLMRLINIFQEHESMPRNYGTDELYYSLEIHTIHIIGKSPGINVTEIAGWHGISKSAVSKVIKKLERKDSVFRYKAPDNNKEVLFELTAKGKKAYQGHIEHHKRQEELIFKKLEEIQDEKLQNFEEVLSIFEEHSERLIKK